jgi:hypothetical protein
LPQILLFFLILAPPNFFFSIWPPQLGGAGSAPARAATTTPCSSRSTAPTPIFFVKEQIAAFQFNLKQPISDSFDFLFSMKPRARKMIRSAILHPQCDTLNCNRIYFFSLLSQVSSPVPSLSINSRKDPLLFYLILVFLCLMFLKKKKKN